MTESFVAAVREYIGLVDNAPSLRPREFLAQCAVVLSRIYSLGQLLPETDPSLAESNQGR